MDHEDNHVSLIGHLVTGMSVIFGVPIEDGERAAIPEVIRSIHVADIEGAGDALAHLISAGFTGHVRMHGDSKSLIDRLAAGTPPRPGSRDAAAIAERERILSELATNFASVEWIWVPSRENSSANGLAWKGVHEVIEHKKMLLKAAETHHTAGGLAALLAQALLPGDTLDRDIAQMQCLCGPCRASRRVTRSVG
jgi:ribonuclease HI